MIQRLARKQSGRRGYGLIELTLAIFLLMVAMTLMVKVVTWVSVERREADRRLWATQEVSNVVERLLGEPFQDVTQESGARLVEKSTAAQELPKAKWDFQVKEVSIENMKAKRATVSLRWVGRSGEWARPVQVTAWTYPKGANP